MIPRSPLPFEEGPEDPGGDDGRSNEGSGAPTGEQDTSDDALAGGWVPPHARHWRHPSEFERGPVGDWPGPTAPPVPALGPGRRRQAVGTVIVAASAAAAVVAGLMLLAGAGSTPEGSARSAGPTPTLAEVIRCCRYVPPAARDAVAGMVSLRVMTVQGHRDVCGVAVATDGLVATTLDALAGARSISAVTSTGRREHAQLVAADPGSDVALVRVDGRLSTAPFTDRPSATGQPALVVAMDPTPRSSGVVWSGSVVRSVGKEITRGRASGMGGIDTAAPAMPTVAGEMLVEPNGRVLGLLDRAASSSSTKVFLPAALVVGVAHALAQSGSVRHGWLGVVGEDTTAALTSPSPAHHVEVSTTVAAVRDESGVMVVKVEPDGPAATILRPDDVIASVDDAALHSMAQLRSMLYVMRPGEQVRLGIVRGGATLSVALVLSASP